MSAVEKASIDLCHDLVCLLEQIVSQLQKHGWTEDIDRAFTTEMTSLLKQQIAGACDLKIPSHIRYFYLITSHIYGEAWTPFYCTTAVLVFFFSLRIIHV